MATLVLERLKCDRQQESGSDEIEIVVHGSGGPRSFKHGGMTPQSPWNVREEVEFRNSVSVEVWEMDRGRDAWIDADDHLGTVSISESEPSGLKQFSSDGADYTLRYRVRAQQTATPAAAANAGSTAAISSGSSSGSSSAAQIVPAARSNANVVNAVRSKVRVLACTDFDKPIKQERVILVRPDGGTEQQNTDDQGIAEFANLTLSTGTRVFVVLPDILEAWDDSGTAQQIHYFPAGTTQPQHQQVTPPGTSTPVGIDRYRSRDKDQIDRMHDTSLQAADAYRAKDRSKYSLCTRDTSASGDPEKLQINLLTEEQKFLHFRELIEGNRAVYEPSNPCVYDDTKQRWHLGGGAVCNQFANFFLGFWFNHNSAFTRKASSTDFLRMMENDSRREARNRIYKYRGFSDCWQTVVTAPAGMISRNHRDRRGRVLRDGTVSNYEYARIRPADWDDANHLFSNNQMMNQLASFNVYSVADGTGFNVDHHGGLFIKPSANELKKMAADGFGRRYVAHNGQNYRYPNTDAAMTSFWRQYERLTGTSHLDRDAFEQARVRKTFSQQRIRHEDPPDLGAKTNYHLRIWALSTLRTGGYAPGNATGNYRTDSELAGEDTISPDFHHSVPRFLKWQGTGRSYIPTRGIRTTAQFMAL